MGLKSAKIDTGIASVRVTVPACSNPVSQHHHQRIFASVATVPVTSSKVILVIANAITFVMFECFSTRLFYDINAIVALWCLVRAIQALAPVDLLAPGHHQMTSETGANAENESWVR